ncbi:hypothetical protein GCM10009801_64990 [Streptomyces albiaxialis]|uniref:Uncharacterized protein n=1 Tax=Streptomyces albiaxialis TaxID=329523 RepID=A0ABP5ICW1_9ACTN
MRARKLAAAVAVAVVAGGGVGLTGGTAAASDGDGTVDTCAPAFGCGGLTPAYDDTIINADDYGAGYGLVGAAFDGDGQADD